MSAGAKWFGYPTFWVNRLALPEEELGVTPDATGHDLEDLVTFVTAPVNRHLGAAATSEQSDDRETA